MGNDKALVLGGGGITGMAWEAGVLAGLIENDINVSSADAIIGTSAGSFIGAILANQVDMKSYYLELPSQISSNDRGSLNSFISSLAKCICCSKDDPIKVGQMLGDIVYTHPSKMPLNQRMHAVRQQVMWIGQVIFL